MPNHRVLIIGGGTQGLTALKNLLELNGPDEQMFEAEIIDCRSSTGGLWSYSQTLNEVETLKSTVTNVSKLRNCYSDFPLKRAWKAAERAGQAPLFANREDFEMYLDQYAKEFGLLKYVRLGYRVDQLKRDGSDRQWEVKVREMKSDEVTTEFYDKVIVATGQYAMPYQPRIEGIENFKGQTFHSGTFKE